MFVPNKSPAPGGSLNIRALRRHLIRWTLWRKLQRIGGQEAPSFNMVRLITLLAAVAAATTAVIVPASCFLVAQARLRGEVEIRALVYAGQVAEEARRNPDFWNALADTASELEWGNLEIGQPPGEVSPGRAAERELVYSSSGKTLIDVATSAMPAWPLLVAHSTVADGGTRLGEVEIQYSLRRALFTAAAAACGSTGLSILLFLRASCRIHTVAPI